MKAILKKVFVLLIVAAVMAPFVLITGCGTGKKEYEERMILILDDVRGDLDSNHKELAKIEMEKSSERKSQRKKSLVEKQIEILENTRDKIQKVKAPDDVYAGHSDLIEFLDLLIDSREATLKTIDQEEDEKDSQTNSEAFKTFQYSSRAFARASSELPFLEYELRDTFETILQDAQMDIQQNSGFGSSVPDYSDESEKTVP